MNHEQLIQILSCQISCQIINVHFPAKNKIYSEYNFIFNFSAPSERVMLTGRHWVRDVFCKKCNDKLGWMYEFALEENQRYLTF